MNMKKGQLSLETIIMLVVLLVLAGAIISLILYYLKPGVISTPQQTLAKRDFLSKCENYCNDPKSLDYCTYYFQGDDWDGDGIKYNIIQVGKYRWYACEDRVYCFLVVPCEDRFGSGLEAIKKCKELLCQTLLDKYDGDRKLATQALYNIVGFSSKCSDRKFASSVPETENWYETVFGEGC